MRALRSSLGIPAALASLLHAAGAGAQPRAVLSFEAFRRQVAEHHPVARQAALAREQAREELRVARGAFDPTLSATVDRKRFGGAEYYDYVEGELKIPTPLGADVKLGYQRAGGRYIAPDRRTPLDGLLTAGVSIPVGQRLLTDERRNALAQARALQDAAEADRAAAVNKLLLSAAKDYAAWYEGTRRDDVAAEGVRLAEFRLAAVRARVARGEAAAIDTVEALLEVRRRAVQRLEAGQARVAASLAVAGYLWAADARPLDLSPDARPSLDGEGAEAVDSAAVAAWLARAARRHPDIAKAAARVEQGRAQRLFAAQQVIPFVEASVSSLADPADAGALAGRAAVAEGYKTGVTARTPLLFLRERGRFNIAAQRLEAQEIERARAERDVALEVRRAANELAVVQEALALQRLAAGEARRLLRAEVARFEAGESQLLVVNLRERQVLDEELKVAALEAKLLGARAALAVATGDAPDR